MGLRSFIEWLIATHGPEYTVLDTGAPGGCPHLF